MATHARFCRGNASKGGLLDRGMAISAIDAQPGHVVLMAEWHHLLARHALAGGVGGPIDQINEPPKNEESQKTADKRDTRDAVAAFSEELGHDFVIGESRVFSFSPACP